MYICVYIYNGYTYIRRRACYVCIRLAPYRIFPVDYISVERSQLVCQPIYIFIMYWRRPPLPPKHLDAFKAARVDPIHIQYISAAHLGFFVNNIPVERGELASQPMHIQIYIPIYIYTQTYNIYRYIHRYIYLIDIHI